MIRYRTESFGGSIYGHGERDAAAVMAFETKELGNTDILEYLRTSVLKDSSLAAKMKDFERELEENYCIDDMSLDDMEGFFKEVLAEIKNESGHNIRYALWLADPPVVLSPDCGYGRDLTDDFPVDAYETGPVILSDLGYDGTLYGYEEYPEPKFSIACAELRRQVSSLDNQISAASAKTGTAEPVNQAKEQER